MTNTTLNVPRELKPCPFCGDIPSENSHALTDGGFKYGAIQCGCGALGPDVRTEYKDWPHWRDAAFAAWNERALLSAPSPAGVDGLEVIGWYTDDHLEDKSATTYSRAVADRWLAKGWPITGIANAADAQAIIDGLRGEVGAQRVKTCAALKARNDAHEERDQQAQRIGELEGLLREERTYASVSASCRKGVVSRCICRNCRLLRIDAALSSGKEGE